MDDAKKWVLSSTRREVEQKSSIIIKYTPSDLYCMNLFGIDIDETV
jgi:hypothetical protein